MSHLALLPHVAAFLPRPGSVTLRTSHKRFSYSPQGLRANSVRGRRETRRKKSEREGRKKRSKRGRTGRKEKMRPRGQRKCYKKKGKMRKRKMRKNKVGLPRWSSG